MTACPKCNAPLGPDDRFCGECGAKVEATAPAPAAARPATTAPEAAPAPAAVPSSPKPLSRPALIAGALLAIGVVLVGIRLYSDSAVDNGAWEGNPDDYRQAPMDDANLRALDEEELLGREEQEAIRREEAARNAYERKKAEERAAYEARERERLARPVNEGDRGYISILGLSLKTDPVSAMVDGRLMTGMLMGGTLPQSNARAAGLKNGDIIIEVQGDPVASRDDVARGLRRARVDGVGAVTLRVLKGGTDPQFIPVELFPLPIPYD